MRPAIRSVVDRSPRHRAAAIGPPRGPPVRADVCIGTRQRADDGRLERHPKPTMAKKPNPKKTKKAVNAAYAAMIKARKEEKKRLKKELEKQQARDREREAREAYRARERERRAAAQANIRVTMALEERHGQAVTAP
jgi:hypothetical protein